MDTDPIPVAPVASGVSEPTGLPEWLQTPQMPTPDDPSSAPPIPTPSSILPVVYANLFENVLERVMAGVPITDIVPNDPRGIQMGRFLYWINRSPERRRRYEEACMVAAETMAHSLVGIADAVDSLEDVQRSQTRLKARTYLMERWNPQRYGDSKRISVESTSIHTTVSPDDLKRMSLADLKRMAYQHAMSGGDVIDADPQREEVA